MGRQTSRGRLGAGKGPGEKEELSCRDVLLTNRSIVKHLHCRPKRRSTLQRWPPWSPSPQRTPPPRGQGPKVSFARPPGSGMRAQRSRSRAPEFRFPGQTPTHPAPRAHAAETPGAGRRALRVGASLLPRRRKRPASGWAGGVLQKRFRLRSRQLPGRPGRRSQTAKDRDERGKQAHGRGRPGPREASREGLGRVQLPLGKPRLQYAALFPVRPEGSGHSFRLGRQWCRRSLYLLAFKS